MIPLYKPFMPELPLINEILQSGKLTYGKYGKEFESMLAEFLGNSNLIVTNTFSNAIMVAISCLELKPGSKVIASPMACLASTQPLLALGLQVVWADVDPKRGTLDPESVRKTIQQNPDIQLIIHNHFCGYSGYINEINQIGKEFGIPVMDDGIEAFGSEYNGKLLGNVGTDITVFSFGAVRIPNTIDGGTVIFKDKTLYEKSLLIRDSGIDRTIFRDEFGEISNTCNISLIGHAAAMSEINSYIGSQQMLQVSKLISEQRKNAKNWDKEFQLNSDILPIETPNANPNYWVYGVLAENKKETMLKFRNSGYYASSVHINNNIYSVFGNNLELAGVNEFRNHFLALPTGWWMNR
ncbi:MAG: aminotransferase class V-fold PLP-dependent enzyme [Bacteroidia bacterium]|nr:aminotransferase class V-fold PLP-dependent enzyme [Bacteroidia bacterium]